MVTVTSQQSQSRATANKNGSCPFLFLAGQSDATMPWSDAANVCRTVTLRGEINKKQIFFFRWCWIRQTARRTGSYWSTASHLLAPGPATSVLRTRTLCSSKQTAWQLSVASSSSVLVPCPSHSLRAVTGRCGFLRRCWTLVSGVLIGEKNHRTFCVGLVVASRRCGAQEILKPTRPPGCRLAGRGGTSARRVHPESGNKTKSFENAYLACLGSSTSLHGSNKYFEVCLK
jgi:hypothetical protein